MTRVSGMVVSVDFGQFLAVTLSRNISFFDEIIVVTSPDDDVSRSVAQGCGAKVVVSEAFWRDGAEFNKAAGLNDGLQIARGEYVFCFDADVLLPKSARSAIGDVDSEVLYGLSRLTRRAADEDIWEVRGNTPQFVVGFSQLFCRTSSSYPGGFCEDFTTAGHYDIEFMCHWAAHKRQHLTSAPALHIGLRKASWRGCRSRTWDVQATLHEKAPRFRLQRYPRHGTLLIQRTDGLQGNCVVRLASGTDLVHLGVFTPGYSREIPWSNCGVVEATLRIEHETAEFVVHCPIQERTKYDRFATIATTGLTEV
jgi:hypothetical protein